MGPLVLGFRPQVAASLAPPDPAYPSGLPKWHSGGGVFLGEGGLSARGSRLIRRVIETGGRSGMFRPDSFRQLLLLNWIETVEVERSRRTQIFAIGLWGGEIETSSHWCWSSSRRRCASRAQ